MRRAEDLLIGGLKIFQDDQLYRFTEDAVLLSRFAAGRRENVADLCAGCGIVGLHFYALHPEAVEKMTFFEMQKPLCDLSLASIKENALEDKFGVVNCRIQDIGGEWAEKFTLALCNPPYFKTDSKEFDAIKACRFEITMKFNDLAAAAAKILRFGGKLCFSHLPERLPEIFSVLKNYALEPKRLRLIESGGKARLALIEAVKGGGEGLRIEVAGEKTCSIS